MGVELDRDTFARALAALGVVWAWSPTDPYPSQLSGSRLREIIAKMFVGSSSDDPHYMLWTLLALPHDLPEPASSFAEAWTDALSKASIRPRLKVRLEHRRWPNDTIWQDEIGPRWLVEQLSRPATGISSVYVSQEIPNNRLYHSLELAA
jgi:hypothetical protein